MPRAAASKQKEPKEPSLVARRIEEVRTSKKLSREELAQRLKTTRLQVWRLETGKIEVSADDVVAYAAALEVTVALLYRESKVS